MFLCFSHPSRQRSTTCIAWSCIQSSCQIRPTNWPLPRQYTPNYITNTSSRSYRLARGLSCTRESSSSLLSDTIMLSRTKVPKRTRKYTNIKRIPNYHLQRSITECCSITAPVYSRIALQMLTVDRYAVFFESTIWYYCRPWPKPCMATRSNGT